MPLPSAIPRKEPSPVSWMQSPISSASTIAKQSFNLSRACRLNPLSLVLQRDCSGPGCRKPNYCYAASFAAFRPSGFLPSRQLRAPWPKGYRFDLVFANVRGFPHAHLPLEYRKVPQKFRLPGVS